MPPEAAILPGRACRAGSVAGRACGFFVQPVRDRHVAACRPRPVRLAPVPARSGTASTGRLWKAHRYRRRCGRWRRRISATAPRPCWILRMDVSQRRPHREFFARSRPATGSCSMQDPGSVPTARGSPWRGSPTSAAISAAPSKVFVIEKRSAHGMVKPRSQGSRLSIIRVRAADSVRSHRAPCPTPCSRPDARSGRSSAGIPRPRSRLRIVSNVSISFSVSSCGPARFMPAISTLAAI